MPTNVTFTTLIQDLQGYLERGGSAASDPQVFAQLPRLVNQTERNIANALKLQGQIEVLVDATGDQSLRSGVPVIEKPDRWRSTISMVFGSGANSNKRRPLYPRSLEFCEAYWPDDSLTGVPKFYADYDYQHWKIAPTPDIQYPLEVRAYMQPPFLDAGNQQNFFTTYTPSLLLYGCLLEATPYLKNDERLPVWQQRWTDQVMVLEAQDLQKILDRTQVRRLP